MLNEMQGTLTLEGTIILDGKPTLPVGPVKVRIETIPALHIPTQADWDAAFKAAAEISDEGYDFDVIERQRDCDIQDAKEHLSRS